MSELGGMLGNLTPVTANPEEDAAALRALLWRRGNRSHLTAEEVFEYGQMLGFWPTPEPPRKPRVRTRQVLERDPSTKRFKSPTGPETAGDRLTHPVTPSDAPDAVRGHPEATVGHQETSGGVA